MEKQAETLPTVEPMANNATMHKRGKKLRTPYALHKTRWMLRAATFVVEFIAFFIIVGLSTTCSSSGWYCNSPFSLVFVGIPMLWDIAEFITLCVNRKGIHPGAHIALDLILFGLLAGPGSILIAAYSYLDTSEYYDCSGSGQCQYTHRERNPSFAASGITSAVFFVIAGLMHLALFIIACIAVHRWRMARRDARIATMQAAYQNPTGHMSVAGNMDPNTAYIVTYADGRQVLVPPQQQQQQHSSPMPQQHGYYAPPAEVGQQHLGTMPKNHGTSVASAGAGAGAGMVAGQYMATQNHSHSPISQVSQSQTETQRGLAESTPSGNTGADSLYANSHTGVVEAPSSGATTRPTDAVPDRR